MELQGFLFENKNENSKIIYNGFIEIEGKRVDVVVFYNVSKLGERYYKILPKKENTEKKKLNKYKKEVIFDVFLN